MRSSTSRQLSASRFSGRQYRKTRVETGCYLSPPWRPVPWKFRPGSKCRERFIRQSDNACCSGNHIENTPATSLAAGSWTLEYGMRRCWSWSLISRHQCLTAVKRSWQSTRCKIEPSRTWILRTATIGIPWCLGMPPKCLVLISNTPAHKTPWQFNTREWKGPSHTNSKQRFSVPLVLAEEGDVSVL